MNYKMLTEAEIFPLYVAEMAERCTAEETVTVTFDMATAQALLAVIQLAFRHPLFKGQTAEECFGIAKGLEDQLARTPAIAEVCRRGWLPEYDTVAPFAVPERNVPLS